MNKSLQKKRAARLAAVQALYNRSVMEQTARPAQRFIDDMLLLWESMKGQDDVDWNANLTPDRPLLTTLVTGVIEYEGALQEHVEKVIKDNWKPERMSPILVAALYCAAYELQHRPDTKAPVVVDEYTSLSGEFFDEPELSYMHSALFQLVDIIRPKSDA